MEEQELIQELQQKLLDKDRQIKILIKQCDEWVKSYDRLLKDFIAYRKETK